MVGVKGKSGGKRAGAGRQPRIGKDYHYKADIDLVAIIDRQPNKNRFINDAVREKAMKDNLL